MKLDKKLQFEEHLRKVVSKVIKTNGITRKLQNISHDRHFLQFISHSLGLT